MATTAEDEAPMMTDDDLRRLAQYVVEGLRHGAAVALGPEPVALLDRAGLARRPRHPPWPRQEDRRRMRFDVAAAALEGSLDAFMLAGIEKALSAEATEGAVL